MMGKGRVSAAKREIKNWSRRLRNAPGKNPFRSQIAVKQFVAMAIPVER
jgi:hypothetical protein